MFGANSQISKSKDDIFLQPIDQLYEGDQCNKYENKKISKSSRFASLLKLSESDHEDDSFAEQNTAVSKNYSSNSLSSDCEINSLSFLDEELEMEKVKITKSLKQSWKTRIDFLHYCQMKKIKLMLKGFPEELETQITQKLVSSDVFKRILN